ncbi:hypothetical protein [Pseudomonas protegens]|uniref:hypothetical protein n=1 Tax=Pseudomonas protegens TaxID=380021 RepID=UPI001F1A871A|nr:hypothetical protein [Pseudomonas protegens]
MLLAVLGGLALGGLFTLLVRGIEALPVAGEGPERQGWSRVLMVPLSGALTLGSIATALYPKCVESLPMFFFGGLIGAWLSVLVCWPMLWLVERVLVTPWRYVIGGGLSGLAAVRGTGVDGQSSGLVRGAGLLGAAADPWFLSVPADRAVERDADDGLQPVAPAQEDGPRLNSVTLPPSRYFDGANMIALRHFYPADQGIFRASIAQPLINCVCRTLG